MAYKLSFKDEETNEYRVEMSKIYMRKCDLTNSKSML